MNEIEESLNEKKRKFKYEIMLSDELNQLKKIEQNAMNTLAGNPNSSIVKTDIIKAAGASIVNTAKNHINKTETGDNTQ